ncbi:MAG: histidinol dehydrogenase [Chitinophagales bacterium]|nr:histidinol dehydrogenase [Chitinophagales bacterium]
MKIFEQPKQQEWASILARPVMDDTALRATVRTVLDDVRARGDEAIIEYTEKFDGVLLKDFAFDENELIEAEAALSHELKTAIQTAAENITTFHQAQLQAPSVIETMPGVRCWRKSVGIETVGIYIPGGTAPLFSTVLMLGIPAHLAGCKRIVLCSPPDKNGQLHPAIIYAAKLVGVTHIYKIGGVQAIAAMAYGTRTVPKVYKIFGPGNQYVTCAKQLVQMEGLAIDMPAGPSEVCVLADASANPDFVAADLLSQAEHGADSQVLLVSNDQQMIPRVLDAVAKQLEALPRKALAAKALEHSRAVYLPDIEEAIALVNAYAAEHLIIAMDNAAEVAEQIVNAGSVFIGHYSPESVGDYASGTNHTLPTNGFAHAYSGVSVDAFVKKITYQQLSQQGLNNIAETVRLMAEAEGLDAHARAVIIRRQHLEASS